MLLWVDKQQSVTSLWHFKDHDYLPAEFVESRMQAPNTVLG